MRSIFLILLALASTHCARPDVAFEPFDVEHRGLRCSGQVGAWSWPSPDHYRVFLTANPGGASGGRIPASVNVNFQQILATQGVAQRWDPDSVEVIAYDALGDAKIFDASRSGYERHL